MAINLPVVITLAGLQPQTPAQLLTQLLTLVSATNPGYTADLPGTLIEDISSTDVGAMTIIDQARVETVNSLTPYGANDFLLNELGQMWGVPLGQSSNTSVLLVFSSPSPGFVIAKGFTVSDGVYQYVVQNGGVINSDGQSSPLYALASQSGSWAVPAGSVTRLVTSVPTPYVLTVVNQLPGVPGTGAETAASYRSRVLQAGLAASQGMPRYLKTLVGNVPGVSPRLIASKQQVGGGWEIIVGGGDPYEVANAIYTALFDVSSLVGSVMSILDITAALPGVVTTLLNHGYAAGQVLAIAGVDPNTYNGAAVVAEVITEKTFKLGTAFAANQLTALSWASTSGGQITGTTTTAHGVTVGSTFVLSGCAPAGYNGTYVAIAGTTGSTLKGAQVVNPGSATVLGQLLAGIALKNTSAFGAYVSGGVITPNLRNIAVTLTDFPDTYLIPFVVPPQEIVTGTVTWNTSSPNFVAPAAVSQLVAPALVDYVNNLFVGQPMSLFRLQEVFMTAAKSVLPPDLVTVLSFEISINGVGVDPEVGTGIIAGDPESYLFALTTGFNIVQG